MLSNDLFNYMRDTTNMMQSEYDRIQKRAVEDLGTAGDNGEENWAELLRKWLPRNYHVVTKGRIMNTEGRCSPQVDVLVLSPSYPEALIGRKEYLEGGVIAAFECKLTLKSEHIRTAVRNANELRRLSQPALSGSPYRELYSRVRYGLLAHSHVWQGEQSTPIKNIETQLYETEEAETQHPRQILDLICISNLASWHTKKLLIAGENLLSQVQARYEPMGKFWDTIKQAGGVVEANHVCHSVNHQTSDREKQLFTPIGSFLTALLEMLSWEDISMRPLAEYFILTKLSGSGEGRGMKWPLTILSDDLSTKLRQGRHLVTGERWNEWHLLL